jgi:hypothetical protein
MLGNPVLEPAPPRISGVLLISGVTPYPTPRNRVERNGREDGKSGRESATGIASNITSLCDLSHRRGIPEAINVHGEER